MYTLGSAARAAGLNKTTVLRAIKSGKISAGRDAHGQWEIDPAELHRVYPPVADAVAEQSPTPPDATALERAVTELREALADMRGQRDKWEAQAVAWQTQAQRLLAAPSPATPPDAALVTPPATPVTAASRLRRTWNWLRAAG